MKTILATALAFGAAHFSRAQIIKPEAKKDSASIAACLLRLSNETIMEEAGLSLHRMKKLFDHNQRLFREKCKSFHFSAKTTFV